MPRTSKKKKRTKSGAGVSGGSEISPPLDPLRRGMPALDSIISVKEMDRGGKTFRVIKTTEIDEYEKPLTSSKRKRG